MSHTNQTTNYHLPQFIGTDKPAWLVDFNQAMSDIDTQMKANETASATAEANAQSALSGVNTLNSQVSGLQADVTAIQTQMPLDEAQIAINTQNISTQASAIVNANNRIDTLNGKVGDLTDLDTTDKTSIVNAVNEVKGDFDRGSVSVTANGVKTLTQLLNELAALIDFSKIRHTSMVEVFTPNGYNVVYKLFSYNNTDEILVENNRALNNFVGYSLYIKANASHAGNMVISATGTITFASEDATVPANGTIYTLTY